MPKIRPVKPEHKHFIEMMAEGLPQCEAYLSVIEKFRPHDVKNRNTLDSMGSQWAKKFQKEIDELIKANFYKKKEERLDVMASAIEKQKEISETSQDTGVTMDEEKQDKMAKLCANPLIVNQALNVGILSLLFDDVEIEEVMEIEEGGKKKKKKLTLIRAVPNRANWLIMPWVKDLISRNLLNSDMFNVKAKAIKPVVASQVNVNVNK